MIIDETVNVAPYSVHIVKFIDNLYKYNTIQL
jgi:hypothetical protein